MTLGEIAAWTHGVAIGDPLLEVTGFALDSREARPGDMFVAIKGDQVDGHTYVQKALEQGAVASLVESEVDGPHVRVTHVVEALSLLAQHFRDQYHGPVIGVTGSVGKTTTKELLAAALSPLGPVAKTEGNRNTEWSGPLLWPEIQNPAAVVVEMGMRGMGQIAHLAGFHKPTLGLVTGIGWSHAALVGGQEGIARAKAELLQALPSDGLAVIAQGPFLGLLQSLSHAPTVVFGDSGPNLDGEVISYQPGIPAHATWRVGDVILEGKLPVPGSHIAFNIAGVLLVARELGVSPALAIEALAETRLPGGRFDIVQAAGATWVLDMYNAAPDSMEASLKTVRELAVERPLVLVLGEMRELGPFARSAHEDIGKLVAELSPAKLIVLDGPGQSGMAGVLAQSAIQAGLEAKRVHKPSDHAGIRALLEDVEGCVVLVKGSRAVELERALPEDVRA